jgi:hypothetical protein
LVILAAIFSFLNSQSSVSFDIRKKAQQTSVSYLILKLSRDSLGNININEATLKNSGFLPTRYFEDGDIYTHRIDEYVNGDVVFSRQFVFNKFVFSPPPIPGLSGQAVSSHIMELELEEAIIEMPFYENALIKVVSFSSGEETELSESDIQFFAQVNEQKVQQNDDPYYEFIYTPQGHEFSSVNSQSSILQLNYDGYFDVLIISSAYTDLDIFHNDAAVIAEFLLGISPFYEYKDRIRIVRLDNTSDLGCPPSGAEISLLSCDYRKITNAASYAPHDTILVIHNTDFYGGAGVWGSHAVTYRDISQWAKQVAVHEMGHSVGYLMDEYDFGTQHNPAKPYAVNCSAQGCAKWQNISDTGCFQVCGDSDAYRPTFDSCIMRTLTPQDGFKFDNVCKNAIVNQLRQYVPATFTPVPTLVNNVSPTTTPYFPTLTPTASPTPIQILSDNAALYFSIYIPDVSLPIGGNLELMVERYNGFNLEESVWVTLQKVSVDNLFETPKTGQGTIFHPLVGGSYNIKIKHEKSIRRSFNNIYLANDLKLYCQDDDYRCGELAKYRIINPEKYLYMGDSDGFISSGSWNRIDIADYQRYLQEGFYSSIYTKSADYNLDGNVNTLDLAVLAKNFGIIGN